ncbi:hypothetical protein EV360DRAFT_77621 [Lentinula raphanica]|nr:hypothetical protein EV360DRAFT_77621 [Lentinula raphanica]
MPPNRNPSPGSRLNSALLYKPPHQSSFLPQSWSPHNIEHALLLSLETFAKLASTTATMTRSTTASRVLAIFFVAAAISSGVLAAPTPAPGPSLESSIDASAQALQAWQHSATDGQGSLSSVGGAGLQQGVNPILHRRELDEENVGRTPMNMGQAEGSTSTAGTQSLQKLQADIKSYRSSFLNERMTSPDSSRKEMERLEGLKEKVNEVLASLKALPVQDSEVEKVRNDASRLQNGINSDLHFVGHDNHMQPIPESLSVGFHQYLTSTSPNICHTSTQPSISISYTSHLVKVDTHFDIIIKSASPHTPPPAKRTNLLHHPQLRHQQSRPTSSLEPSPNCDELEGRIAREVDRRVGLAMKTVCEQWRKDFLSRTQDLNAGLPVTTPTPRVTLFTPSHALLPPQASSLPSRPTLDVTLCATQ